MEVKMTMSEYKKLERMANSFEKITSEIKKTISVCDQVDKNNIITEINLVVDKKLINELLVENAPINKELIHEVIYK